MFGGLKIIDLEKFIKAQQTTWIRRLSRSEKYLWQQLFEITIAPITNFTQYGLHWLTNLINKTENIF